MPPLSEWTGLLTALAAFSWPLIFIVCAYFLKDKWPEVIRVILRRIESATDIEFGLLKFKGATVTMDGDVLKGESGEPKLERAQEPDVRKRAQVYLKRRNLMLVHTIKPAQPAKFAEGKYRIFGVSVFLHSHRQRGNFHDVKKVTYFLGEHWGSDDHSFGSKYVIDDASEQFAMTAEMYGSCLCMAEIEFHDGVTIQVDRYLDVEMAPAFGIPLSSARQ